MVSMFPAIVGSTFPGAKYLRQTAMFRNECPVGARVTATVRKVKETRGGKIVEFETKVRCAEDEGKVYVDGFALAKMRGQFGMGGNGIGGEVRFVKTEPVDHRPERLGVARRRLLRR